MYHVTFDNGLHRHTERKSSTKIPSRYGAKKCMQNERTEKIDIERDIEMWRANFIAQMLISSMTRAVSIRHFARSSFRYHGQLAFYIQSTSGIMNIEKHT